MVWLAISVEEVEFHEFSNRLRIHGIIVKGPDELGLKAYHTLNFTSGSELELEKPLGWRKHQMDLLKEAVNATGQPKTIVISIEDDNALIAQIYQYGIRKLAIIERTGGGKYFSGVKTTKVHSKSSSDAKKDYFDDILLQLNQVRPENEPILIVGPGFAKDQLLSFFRDKQVSEVDKILVEPTGQSGMPGIKEAIKRGIVKRLVQESRISFETELIEKLLEGIAKDDPVIYGMTETQNAVSVGAVEYLLVTDLLIRAGDEHLEEMMNNAESSGGKVVIISTVHDAGKQLESLGGVAGLLRYKLSN
jgi:protein pelota